MECFHLQETVEQINWFALLPLRPGVIHKKGKEIKWCHVGGVFGAA